MRIVEVESQSLLELSTNSLGTLLRCIFYYNANDRIATGRKEKKNLRKKKTNLGRM